VVSSLPGSLTPAPKKTVVGQASAVPTTLQHRRETVVPRCTTTAAFAADDGGQGRGPDDGANAPRLALTAPPPHPRARGRLFPLSIRRRVARGPRHCRRRCV